MLGSGLQHVATRPHTHSGRPPRSSPAVPRIGSKPAAAGPKSTKTDLRKVPGIGQHYAAKLVSHQCSSVSELCRRFSEDHQSDTGKFREYLQGLGIRKRWLDAIVSYVEAQSKPASSQLTFCVEGNIGSGKSTYLDMVRNCDAALKRGGQPALGEAMLQQIIEVVPEPVDQWQDVGGANLLEEFYRDPVRYAYTFQSYVFVTRLLQEERSRKHPGQLRLLERSVFCDRMVFVKAVHEASHLSDLELKVYDSWFNPMLDLNPHLRPDAFVYLKTHPDTCMRRLRHRARSEEVSIQPPYLERLSAFHDQWLLKGAHPLGRGGAGAPGAGPPRLIMPGHSMGGQPGTPAALLDPHAPSLGDLIIPKLPANLVGNVVLLDSQLLDAGADGQQHAMPRLNKVPALHVDNNGEIDVTDQDEMKHRAQIMTEFRKWVLQYQAANQEFLDEQDRSLASMRATMPERLPGPLARARLTGSLEALSNVL